MPRLLDFGNRTYVMGVLNVTPDSFSDGKKFFDSDKAIAHGLAMAREAADIIDIGGESTRPGSGGITVDEELDRVMPVIEGISREADIPISIDTRKAEVAEKALSAGARIINDISGLRYDNRMASVIAKYGAWAIVMHIRGTPQDMQVNPVYNDLIKEILSDLKDSITIAKKAGVREDRIIIDPGIGFGKTAEHNLKILNRLDEFKVLGRPICIGTSRKSFIGKVLGIENPAERLAGTIATCAIAVMKGANILRVHDVKEIVQTARLIDSIMKERIS